MYAHLSQMWAQSLEHADAENAFFGDSRVAGADWYSAYPGKKVINLGVGGDRGPYSEGGAALAVDGAELSVVVVLLVEAVSCVKASHADLGTELCAASPEFNFGFVLLREIRGGWYVHGEGGPSRAASFRDHRAVFVYFVAGNFTLNDFGEDAWHFCISL